jgi:hypothetical protein
MGAGERSSWEPLLNQVVVVDTDSHLLYIGRLHEVTEDFVILRDADVHDTRESSTTKERYAMEAKRIGVRPNRREVSIRKTLVVSVSRLEDIIEY